MSFRPKDFGKVAEEIYNALQQSGTIPISNTVIEAWIRTAISRAYYSAFLLINERSGKKFHGKRAHEDLVNYLKGKRGIYSIIGTSWMLYGGIGLKRIIGCLLSILQY